MLQEASKYLRNWHSHHGQYTDRNYITMPISFSARLPTWAEQPLISIYLWLMWPSTIWWCSFMGLNLLLIGLEEFLHSSTIILTFEFHILLKYYLIFELSTQLENHLVTVFHYLVCIWFKVKNYLQLWLKLIWFGFLQKAHARLGIEERYS